ncbi:MAG: efflux RND transporter periplasmic adaptor subunit [Gammaproteobacteria bacterium]|nr:efflux RND transporter periplasmic adaptor subunit [Gammaproteobacteria bacterium]
MKNAALPLILCGILLSGCGSPEELVAPPAVGVGVYELSELDITRQWRISARTRAADSVQVRARVEGEVQEVLFERGTRVNAGDPLFRLKGDTYREQVRRADAQLAARRSAQVLARRNLERALEINERGYLSAADMDRLRNEAEMAESALADAEAVLRQTRLNLDYTTITAPISGRIGNTAVTVGNLVGPGSGPLVEIIAPDRIRAEFQLTDREFTDLVRMHGQGLRADAFEVYLLLEDNQPHPTPGTVDFVDIAVNQSTGTVDATALFDNVDEMLVPGMFVTLLFSSAEPAPGLLLPEQAVQRNQLGPFVMLVDHDGGVSVRQVTLGARQGPAWQLESGLRLGDLVVVEGLQKIRPGATVQPSYYERDPATGLLAPSEMIRQ